MWGDKRLQDLLVEIQRVAQVSAEELVPSIQRIKARLDAEEVFEIRPGQQVVSTGPSPPTEEPRPPEAIPVVAVQGSARITMGVRLQAAGVKWEPPPPIVTEDGLTLDQVILRVLVGAVVSASVVATALQPLEEAIRGELQILTGLLLAFLFAQRTES